MFFGIGAYGVAIRSRRASAATGWPRSRWASSRRWRFRCCCSLVIGLLQPARAGDLLRDDHARRRRRPSTTLASQLSAITGGEDGLTFKRARSCCSPSFEPFEDAALRCVPIDGRIISYYRPARRRGGAAAGACCASSTRRSAACCRRSARTTSAPRRSAIAPSSTARSSSVLSALFATLAGALLALWLRYNGPDTTLSLRDHARRAADRRDRRHGHDLRRGGRQRAASCWRRTTCRT